MQEQLCHHSCWKSYPAPPDKTSMWHHRRQWYSEIPVCYQIFVGEESYVGCTKNLTQRVGPNHPWASKGDRFRILCVFDEDISRRALLAAERYWINLLQPELNKK